jgi:hypothetical protein
LERSRRNLDPSQSAALNKLGEEFVESLCASFEAKGAQVIRRVCEEKPRAFLQVVARLSREEPLADRGKLDDLAPDELDRMLEAVLGQ